MKSRKAGPLSRISSGSALQNLIHSMWFSLNSKEPQLCQLQEEQVLFLLARVNVSCTASVQFLSSFNSNMARNFHGWNP